MDADGSVDEAGGSREEDEELVELDEDADALELERGPVSGAMAWGGSNDVKLLVVEAVVAVDDDVTRTVGSGAKLSLDCPFASGIDGRNLLIYVQCDRDRAPRSGSRVGCAAAAVVR